jgi:hypothetical protein
MGDLISTCLHGKASASHDTHRNMGQYVLHFDFSWLAFMSIMFT